MACPHTNPTDLSSNLTDFLLAFTASYSLFGQFSATARFSNHNGEWDALDLIDTAIELDMTTVLDGCECTALLAALTGSYDCADMVIKGLIRDITYQDTPTGREVTLQIGSFFDRLSKKALTTERFVAASANSTLSTVAQLYLGIPSALLDFNSSSNLVDGAVEGDSGLEELSRLAQAGRSHLFVQVGGNLTTSQWKDHNSSIDWYVPNSIISAISDISQNSQAPTVINLTGNVQTQFECDSVFSDARISGSNTGGYASIGGANKLTAFNGVSKKTTQVDLSNLKANKKDLTNAAYIAQGVVVDGVNGAVNGGLNFEITDDTSEWMGLGFKDFKIVVHGKGRPNDEKQAQKGLSKSQNVSLVREKNRMNDLPAKFDPQQFYRFPGLGTSGPQFNDETVEGVISTFAVDTGLLAQYGEVYESVDNPYVPSKENLFRIGIRRFQEYKMMRKNYQLTIPVLLKCIQLNDVIQFEEFETEESTGEVIDGIVHSISYTYEADTAKASTTLGVMDVGQIGTTAYQSGNIFNSGCNNEENTDAVSIWRTDAGPGIGDVQSDIWDDCMWHYVNANPGVVSYIDQVDMDASGDTLYTFQLEATYLGTLVAATTVGATDGIGSLGSVAVSSDGTKSFSFTGRDTAVTFDFTSLYTGTQYLLEMCSVSLFATVTA